MPGNEFLMAMTVKATLVLLIAYAAATVAKKRAASERHLLWALAMLSVLALPLWEIMAPPSAAVPVSVVVGPVLAEAVPATDAAATPRIAWLPVVWLCGALATLVFFATGHLILLWRFRDRRRVDAMLPVYESARCTTPMAWGLLRPVVMLPPSAREWDEVRRRVVLLHEMAHVERRDCLTQALAQMACAFYWFHPLVWMGASAMRKEREKACDDAVLRNGARPTEYAEHLLRLAQAGVNPAALAMADASHLESRIRAALDKRVARHRPTATRVAALSALCVALVLPLAVLKGQGNGSVKGSVIDISGGAVPKAQVLILAADGSRKEITTTADDGTYKFANLTAGRYTIEVRARGFALATAPNVMVRENQSADIQHTMQMGRIQETIEVVGKGRVATPVAMNTTPQRIRVGGNVQATKLLKQTRPQYPEHLQAQGVEGTVLLEGVISVEGDLISLRTTNTQVHPELVKAATDAVSQWKYQPTLLNGKPVEVITTIQVNYRLAQ